MPSKFSSLACAALLSTALASPAFADEPMSFRTVDGRIVAYGSYQPDTAIMFDIYLASEGKLNDAWNTVMVVTSGGGALDAALTMGRVIRAKGISTVAHGVCASACTYMMMGGVNRVVTKDTQYGIHQISFTGPETDPNAPIFSPSFMVDFQKSIATLQDYVDEMGVNPRIIGLASKTPPDDIDWLTREELIAMKIENVPYAEDGGQSYETLNIPGVTGPETFDLASLEIPSLYNQLSLDGPIKLESLAKGVATSLARRVILAETQTEEEMDRSLLNSYALNVEYDGKIWSGADILAEKRRMIKDWGVRRRTIDEDSLKVTCSDNDTVCSVTGEYTSELGLSEDGFISKARWSFSCDVILPMSAPRVVRETSELIQ